MKLKLPHVAAKCDERSPMDSIIYMSTRPDIGAEWTDESESDKLKVLGYTDSSITLAVHHFSSYAAHFRRVVSV